MTPDKTKLVGFSLKLSNDDRHTMKLICAMDRAFTYQYEVLDAAMLWAIENKEKLVAIANPKDGELRSYYLSETAEQIAILEDEWNCNPTRALYTAVIFYLKHREKEANISSSFHGQFYHL